MPRPCLIAIDMDGTLLSSDGQISPRNREALRRAEQARVEIVIATGRRHAYAMRVLRTIHLPSANALISSNGTVTRTIGAELVHRKHLPLQTARWLCDAVGEFRDTLLLTFDNVDEHGDDRPGALICEANHALHASIDPWMRSNAPYIAHVERIEHALRSSRPRQSSAVALEELETETISAPIQAMLSGSLERMQRAETLLCKHPAVAGVGAPEFPGCEVVLHRTVYPDRDLAILDILPAGCSKASALERLAELRGCTLAQVMAIGDNWNDLPMLQAAGRAVLMGNAPDELKALAREYGWTLGPTNDEDGVAVAIEAALTQAFGASVPPPGHAHPRR